MPKQFRFFKLSRETKLLFILVVLLIVFIGPIEGVFNRFLIDPILSQAASNVLIDLFALVFVIWSIPNLFFKIKRRTNIGFGYFTLLVLFLGIYIYYRFFTNHYVFLESHFFQKLKYLDIPMIYCFALVCTYPWWLLSRGKQKDNSKIEELVDEPINSKSEDILGRMPKVKILVNEIINTQNNSSIAYGVTGEWGSGKTSFLKLVENEILKRSYSDILIIKFNPWLNLSANTIIQEFFDVLQEGIKPYSYDLYREVGHYSKNLINSAPSTLMQFIGYFTVGGKNSSVSKEFRDINTSMKYLDKKFLIIVDDMDRLKSEEVFEVLKLIRNTAGFDNFIYLVAYDKSYVSESLKGLGIPIHNSFAEKIFLREEHLLPINESKIKRYLVEQLKRNLPDNLEEINSYFNSSAKFLSRDREDFVLKHIRDVKRFLNGFLKDYNEISDDVDFKDYLNIKLLKFKYYDVYRLLFLDTYYYLDPTENLYTPSGKQKGSLQLAFDEKKGITIDRRFREFKESRLGEYVLNNYSWNEKGFKALKVLIYSLFTADSIKRKNPRSIIFASEFKKYFQDILEENEISERHFIDVLKKDYQEIIHELNHWQKNGNLEAAKNRFNEIVIENLKNKDEYEKIIKSIFSLASFKRDQHDPFYDYLGFDPHWLKDAMGDYDYKISRLYYNGSRENLKKFIKYLFVTEEYSTMFCASLLNFWYSNYYDENFIFSKQEIKYQLIQYFKNYVQNTQSPEGAWSYYYYCLVKEWDQVSSNTRQSRTVRFEEANEIFISLIEKNLDYFLIRFIQPPHLYGYRENKLLSLSDMVNEIFGDLDSFIKFLKKSEKEKKEGKIKSSFIEEFIIFAEKVVKSGTGVDFEFEFAGAREYLESMKVKLVNN
ncbi:KAP family P-loop NTPase fold protein [[Muricauda] lutisoli]|uniref:KAP NTPase domain-containing protein n=1 Tax=[Muricauda] lutisoli TaxID=2816035 RepID=A0ABS3EV18_9FLAO|nr:P-loop NTPase fold protein [[Muricauda] lutisoli]MBO0330089.1 hypothetical protein [[Muricauda] lutisoli]